MSTTRVSVTEYAGLLVVLLDALLGRLERSVGAPRTGVHELRLDELVPELVEDLLLRRLRSVLPEEGPHDPASRATVVLDDPVVGDRDLVLLEGRDLLLEDLLYLRDGLLERVERREPEALLRPPGASVGLDREAVHGILMDAP
jgi:hypothetical protein